MYVFVAKLCTKLSHDTTGFERKQWPIGMKDYRLEDLRGQIYPQSGADSNVIIVDSEAALVDDAAIEDTGGSILKVAGRPQPPPAVAVFAIDIHFISNCIIGKLTPPCPVGAEIFFRFGDAKQEDLIPRCIAGVCAALGIFICRYCYCRYH